MTPAIHGAACWFGRPMRPLYGWLHGAQAPARDLGVVLCAAFGREELSTHQTLRTLALALAARGMPVLRFDYPGCGDSYGDEHTANLLQAWLDATGQAADHLRRTTGVTRIAFVGMRLGALLAAQTAAARTDSAALVAIMPPGSGRAFVRELSMLGGSGTAADGTIEAGGYRLAAATAAALSGWNGADRLAAPQVLVVDHANLPASASLAKRWQSLGAQVDNAWIPGLLQILMSPHEAQDPPELIERVADWLGTRAGEPGPRTLGTPPAPVALQQADMAGLQEQLVQINAGALALAGVLTRPADKRCRGAVAIVNGGAARRIGSGRLHVELARRLAGAGWQVLRFDIRGLGDTAAIAGQPRNQAFPPGALDDLTAAIRWLQAQTGMPRCEVIGLCSGAYHAYSLAARGGPLAGFVAINPLNFGPPDDEDPMSPDKVIGEFQRYRKKVRQRAAWLKLLRGQADLRHISATATGFVKLWRSMIGSAGARPANLPLAGDVPADLLRMTDAGTRVRFVFARNDPGDMLLAGLGGATLRRLLASGKVVIERVDDADHTFSRHDWRLALFEQIERLLEPHGVTHSTES